MNQARLMRDRAHHGRSWLSLLLLTALGIGGLAACRTTTRVSETPKDFSGFLGDYSNLQKGSEGEANYLYIDKSVKWSKYTKVCIKPVQLWKSGTSDSVLDKLSPEQQQRLVNLLHTALAEQAKRDFQIVDQAGPDVLVVHAAITGGRGSKPVLNLVSSVLPAGLIISYAKQAITGTGAGVGVVYIEAEFTDGVSGKRVAAVADARAGTKAWRTKFDGTWGDAKLAFDWWAQRMVERVELLKSGNFGTESL